MSMPSDSKSAGLQWPSCDAVIERQSFQVLHHDERLTFVLSDFVDGADVGMVQRRRRPRLSAEAFQGLRVFSHRVRQELQSDHAAEFEVFGLVDHTHPTATELLDDVVMRDGLPDHLARILRGEAGYVNESRAVEQACGVVTIQGLWRCFSDSSIALRNCSTASTCGAFSESFAI